MENSPGQLIVKLDRFPVSRSCGRAGRRHSRDISPLSQASFVHEIYFNHDLASQLLHVLENVAANIEKDVCIFSLKLSRRLGYYV